MLLTVLLDDEVSIIEREIYSVIHGLQDVGGFASVILLCFRIVLIPLKKFYFWSEMAEKLMTKQSSQYKKIQDNSVYEPSKENSNHGPKIQTKVKKF